MIMTQKQRNNCSVDKMRLSCQKDNWQFAYKISDKEEVIDYT